MPRFEGEFEIPADAWLLSKASAYLENNTLTAEMTGSLLLQIQAIETVPLGWMPASEFSEVNLARNLFQVTRDLVIEKGIILRRQALQRELSAINDEAMGQYDLHRERIAQSQAWAPPLAFDLSAEPRWQEAYARLQADPKPILAETGNAFILLCRQRGLTLLQGLSQRDLVSGFLSQRLPTPPKAGRSVSPRHESAPNTVRYSSPRESLFEAVTEFNRVMAETWNSDLLLGAMLVSEKRKPRRDFERLHLNFIRTRWHGATDLELIHEARLLLRRQWLEDLNHALTNQSEFAKIQSDTVWLESEVISDSIGGIVTLQERELFRPGEKSFDALELQLHDLKTLRAYGKTCGELCERHGLLPFEGVFDFVIGSRVLHPEWKKDLRLRPMPWVSFELYLEAMFGFIEWRTGRDLRKPNVNESVL